MKSTNQITVRLTLPEFQEFDAWRVSQNLAESQALCDLIERFFDGGYRRSPEHRLEKLRTELDNLFTGEKNDNGRADH